MAKIFTRDRIVPIWLEVIQHLAKNGWTDTNLILEIEQPLLLTVQDKAHIAIVDNVLRKYCDSSIKTVASTIFPQAIYQRHGRPAFYASFQKQMVRAKKKGTWGTYALRIMERRASDPAKTVNPLEQIICKLIRASTVGHPYHNNYELGVTEPYLDLDDPFGCELPTFDVSRDGTRVSNMPCLSHLSFKMINKDQLNLTAIYRSHHYCSKALGNLIGLTQLLQFVAKESKLKVGTLTCISTHAQLEPKSWGNPAAIKALITDLENLSAD